MRPYFQFLLIFLSFHLTAFTQNVSIGITTPSSSAMLDVQSTNKGMLVPSIGQQEKITSLK